MRKTILKLWNLIFTRGRISNIMFLYIKQSNNGFTYRKHYYKTPVEISFDKDSTQRIINLLHKQDITDYNISKKSTFNKKEIDLERSTSEQSNKVEIIEKEKIIYINDNSDIINALETLGNKINNIESKIEKQQNTVIVKESDVSEKQFNKKDDIDAFIPDIDTSGMGIKSNIKAKKSETNSDNVDILRQLLKGI